MKLPPVSFVFLAAAAFLVALMLPAIAAPKATPTPRPAPAVTSPAPAPTVPPAASPGASPAANGSSAASPAVDPLAEKQNRESREVIVTAYVTEIAPYLKANEALQAAGGFGPAGLSSNEAIAERRRLVAACMTANDAVIAFLNSEADALRAELGKVGMPPADIDQYVSHFTPAPETPLQIQARAATKATLQTMDELLTYLDSAYGKWTLHENSRVTFKNPGDMKKYAADIVGLNKAINEQNAVLGKLKATQEKAGAGASPAASPGASEKP